jgi:hypothetical protein
MHANPTHLDYAPAPSALARRSVRRKLVWAVAMLALIVLARPGYQVTRRVIADFSRQVVLAKREAAFAGYSAPPDRIITSDDPADIATLGAAPCYFKVDLKPTFFGGGGSEQHFRFANQPHRPAVVYVPPLCQGPCMFLSGPQAIAFAHPRRAPGGAGDRLVVAWLKHASSAQYPDDRILIVEAMARKPAGYWPYARTTAIPIHRIVLKIGPEDHVRAYAGQPDAKDPARFTVHYTLNDRPGLITGTLHADDTVAFTHTGPAPEIGR